MYACMHLGQGTEDREFPSSTLLQQLRAREALKHALADQCTPRADAQATGPRECEVVALQHEGVNRPACVAMTFLCYFLEVVALPTATNTRLLPIFQHDMPPSWQPAGAGGLPAAESDVRAGTTRASMKCNPLLAKADLGTVSRTGTDHAPEAYRARYMPILGIRTGSAGRS